jgi:hypothetical protein
MAPVKGSPTTRLQSGQDHTAGEGAEAIKKGYNSRRNDYLLSNLPISNSPKLSYLLARRRRSWDKGAALVQELVFCRDKVSPDGATQAGLFRHRFLLGSCGSSRSRQRQFFGH